MADPAAAQSPIPSHKKPQYPLPPNWEKVKTEKGVYYWNKEDGSTQWNFPEKEAKLYLEKVNTHTYINVNKGSSSSQPPSSPSPEPKQDTSTSSVVVTGDVVHQLQTAKAASEDLRLSGSASPTSRQQQQQQKRQQGRPALSKHTSSEHVAPPQRPKNQTESAASLGGQQQQQQHHQRPTATPISPTSTASASNGAATSAKRPEPPRKRISLKSPLGGRDRPPHGGSSNSKEPPPPSSLTPASHGNSTPPPPALPVKTRSRVASASRLKSVSPLPPAHAPSSPSPSPSSSSPAPIVSLSARRATTTSSSSGRESETPPPIPAKLYNDHEESPPPPIPDRRYFDFEANNGSSSSNNNDQAADDKRQGRAATTASGDRRSETEAAARDRDPPEYDKRKKRVARQVSHQVTEQGAVYSDVNPAWKKGAPGRSPSLTALRGIPKESSSGNSGGGSTSQEGFSSEDEQRDNGDDVGYAVIDVSRRRPKFLPEEGKIMVASPYEQPVSPEATGFGSGSPQPGVRKSIYDDHFLDSLPRSSKPPLQLKPTASGGGGGGRGYPMYEELSLPPSKNQNQRDAAASKEKSNNAELVYDEPDLPPFKNFERPPKRNKSPPPIKKGNDHKSISDVMYAEPDVPPMKNFGPPTKNTPPPVKKFSDHKSISDVMYAEPDVPPFVNSGPQRKKLSAQISFDSAMLLNSGTPTKKKLSAQTSYGGFTESTAPHSGPLKKKLSGQASLDVLYDDPVFFKEQQQPNHQLSGAERPPLPPPPGALILAPREAELLYDENKERVECEDGSYMMIDRKERQKLQQHSHHHQQPAPPPPPLSPPPPPPPLSAPPPPPLTVDLEPPPIPTRLPAQAQAVPKVPAKAKRSPILGKKQLSADSDHTLSPNQVEFPRPLSPKSDYSSLFEESGGYALPSNSRRLKELNVTLRREQQPSYDSSGMYSKLDLTREALLLRSGVTLSRTQGSKLASMKSLDEEERTEGEGEGEGWDGYSSEEDALLDKTTTDKMKLEKVSFGPPKWIDYKRAQHLYESVENQQQHQAGHDTTLDGSNQLGVNAAASRSLSDLLEGPDLDWDDTDMGLNPSISASQPNLSDIDPQAFPHLQKPDRVSVDAYLVRKQRMMQHNYEDIDMSQWPDLAREGGEEEGGGGGGDSIRDVRMLQETIRTSLVVEGDGEGGSRPHDLPRGWQVMQDEEGKEYYWHIASGKTQYARPVVEKEKDPKKISILDVQSDEPYNRVSFDHQRSQGIGGEPNRRGKKGKDAQDAKRNLIFSVRYLGFYPVQEVELVTGKCVKVVHDCIKMLISAHRDVDKGEAVFLQIQDMELRWLDPETSTPRILQPISRIRVWGIGMENERDFGYVARDPVTQKHKCHVFRCDAPARAVAKALLESHKKQGNGGGGRGGGGGGVHASLLSTEATHHQRKDMQNGRRASSSTALNGRTHNAVHHPRQPPPPSSSSPSPSPSTSSEQYVKIQCMYMGCCRVAKETGMDLLNEAVDVLSTNSSRWIGVTVNVAASHVKIVDRMSNKLLREHRVRFLCFLGIAKDDRFCGYIVDCGERDGEKYYQFHGFMKDPNTDQLCLSLHNACQARYQRVLESNPTARQLHQQQQQQQQKEQEEALAAAAEEERNKMAQQDQSRKLSFFERIGSFKNRGRKSLVEEEPRLHSYVVQYLGSLPVPKSEGLEVVREPVQKLSLPKTNSSSAAHLVEFEVTRSGLTLVDPHKKLHGRKHFSVKNITYIVRMRTYFAFIAKEGGKYVCHVFLESEVDAGTVVSTMQRMLAPDTKPPPTKN